MSTVYSNYRKKKAKGVDRLVGADKLGGYSFPFLGGFKEWDVVSRKLGGEEDLIEALSVSNWGIRIVRDDGVVDFYARQGGKIVDFEGIMKAGHLVVEAPYSAKTMKRLSRLFRLSLGYKFYSPDDDKRPQVTRVSVRNPALYDAALYVSRSYVEAYVGGLDKLTARFWGKAGLFEATVQGDDGQYKGQALVLADDKMPVRGSDIVVIKESVKGEVKMEGGWLYVDLRPVFGKGEWLSDVQTTINIYHELFGAKQLVAMVKEYAKRHLLTIRDGNAEEAFQNLVMGIHDLGDYEAIENWTLFQYLASGGRLENSSFFTRQYGGIFRKRLERKMLMGHRVPITGGFRLYVKSASAMGANLGEGEALIDWGHASLLVSDQQYLAADLGGHDMDDAVNIVMDINGDAIISRNPNARGEWELVHVLNGEEAVKQGVTPTQIEWKNLLGIPCVKERTFTWKAKKEGGALLVAQKEVSFKAFANELLVLVAKNQAVLGQHINVLAACTLTLGDEPMVQPASTETIVDSSVKDLGTDLSSVKAWARKTANSLVGLPMCRDARRRIRSLVGDAELIEARGHWLDSMEEEIKGILEAYTNTVEAFARATELPEKVYERGGDWLDAGGEFRRMYGKLIGASEGEPSFGEISLKCEGFLAEFEEREQEFILLGALTSAYTSGPSQTTGRIGDAAVWQEGYITNATLRALRGCKVLDELGFVELLGEVVATPVARMDRKPKTIKRLMVTAVWYRQWCAEKGVRPGEVKMGDIPETERAAMKSRVAVMANNLVTCQVVVKANEAFTNEGVAFGFHKGDDQRVVVVQATAKDGNLVLLCR